MSTEESDGIEITYCTFQSQFGKILLASTNKGICFLSAGENAYKELQQHIPTATLNEQTTDQHRQLMETIEKWPTLPPANSGLTLHVKCTDFQYQVWQQLLTIPSGTTVTYSTIAQAIGKPRAQRATGTAIGKNNIAILIPCHRVINQNGTTGGYRWGREMKKKLQEIEFCSSLMF